MAFCIGRFVYRHDGGGQPGHGEEADDAPNGEQHLESVEGLREDDHPYAGRDAQHQQSVYERVTGHRYQAATQPLKSLSCEGLSVSEDLDAETLGYALLFSVPVGVGVALAVLATTAGTYMTTAAVGGLLAAVLVFLLVVAGARGRPDEDAAERNG